MSTKALPATATTSSLAGTDLRPPSALTGRTYPPTSSTLASYAQIATIDENLVRRVLHAADVAWLTAERKRLYLARHPETAATSAGGSFRGNQHTEVNDNLSPTFTEATATATGTSVRAVERNARRGNALKSDLARIAGTSLDKGTELDALVKLTPDQRAPIVERANAGEKVSAVAAIAKAKAEKPKREAESDEVNEALSDAEVEEVDRYIEFRESPKSWVLSPNAAR